MSSAEAAQAMSKEIQLSLGPDAGPNDDSAQVGEAAMAREPRSRYRPDGSRRRTQAAQGQREGEPVQNRSQTWQDRRTSETASESASTRTRNAQQTWNQKGQDWQRDRPSSSQDWRHDWQWEGDRDHTLKGSSASNTARGSQRTGPGRCGTKIMQAVRLPPLTQAQANQGSLPVHSLDRSP